MSGEGEVDTEHSSPRLGQTEGGVEMWADLTSQVFLLELPP